MRKFITYFIAVALIAGMALAAGNPSPTADNVQTLGKTGAYWLALYANGWYTTNPAVEFAHASTDAVYRVKGYESSSAALDLMADEGDDADDHARIAMLITGNLSFQGTSGTNPVAVLDMSTGDLQIDGDLDIDGDADIKGALKLKYASKTASYTTTTADCILNFTTPAAAITNILPEASTALGRMFMVGLHTDGGGNLLVQTDQTDKFDAANDILTFADAGDSCVVVATGANVYTILVNVGGTLSD